MKNHQESTYALLVRSESEEKSRGALETIAYITCIVSVAVAIWQFAHHPVVIPASGIEGGVVDAAEVIQTNSPS